MKNIKKVVAAGLVLSMAMSMAGCMGGGKLAPSKLAAAAKKNGCELIKDPDDFEDEMEEDEVEDGIYITVEGSDLKDILKDNSFTGDVYDKSIKTATVVYFAGDDGDTGAFIMCFTFSSKKDAEDYYEDMLDTLEDHEDRCADSDSDDGEEKGITYYAYQGRVGYGVEIAEGIYMSGKNVLVIIGAGMGSDDYNDYIEDVASCYDIILPDDV